MLLQQRGGGRARAGAGQAREGRIAQAQTSRNAAAPDAGDVGRRVIWVCGEVDGAFHDEGGCMRLTVLNFCRKPFFSCKMEITPALAWTAT